MKDIVIVLILFSTSFLFAQNINIKIPDSNFNSGIILNIKSDKTLDLKVDIINLEDNTSIKEFILNVTNKSLYKIDLSYLELEKNYKLIIRKENEIIFQSIISNFTNK